VNSRLGCKDISFSPVHHIRNSSGAHETPFSWDLFCFPKVITDQGAQGRVDGSGSMLQAGKWRVQFPMWSLNSFILQNVFDWLILTQPLTETRIRRYFCDESTAGA
jgi:hypothetical protein